MFGKDPCSPHIQRFSCGTLLQNYGCKSYHCQRPLFRAQASWRHSKTFVVLFWDVLSQRKNRFRKETMKKGRAAKQCKMRRVAVLQALAFLLTPLLIFLLDCSKICMVSRSRVFSGFVYEQDLRCISKTLRCKRCRSQSSPGWRRVAAWRPC